MLRAELDRVRHDVNTVRLHAGIGYVTPGDEHDGRGPAIRQARKDGTTVSLRCLVSGRVDLAVFGVDVEFPCPPVTTKVSRPSLVYARSGPNFGPTGNWPNL